MQIGIILVAITALCMLMILLFNKWAKKVFKNYYFLSIISICLFIYFCIFRYIPDIMSLTEVLRNNETPLSIHWSKALLLDLCPFLAFFVPVIIVFDRNRKVISYISYFGVVGGSVTIFGQIWMQRVGTFSPNGTFIDVWWKFVFLDKLYFIMHFWVLILSIIFIMNSMTLNWKQITWAHVFIAGYFIYVAIIVFSLNIKNNATGLVPGDWEENGQYGVVGKILNLPWPLQPIIGFLFVTLWIWIMFLWRNMLCLDTEFISHDTFLRNNSIDIKWIKLKRKIYQKINHL